MTPVYSRPSYRKARFFTTGQRPMNVQANDQTQWPLAVRLAFEARAVERRRREPLPWPLAKRP